MGEIIANKDFSLFFKINLLVTIVIFLVFLQYNNNYHLVDFILAFLGAVSSAAIIYALLYLFLFIFKFMGRFGLYVSALILVLVNMALLVDLFIYKLFKFHINGMVVNMLTSPDAMDSIQAGIAPVIAFIAVVITFLLFEFYLIKKIIRKNNRAKFHLNSKLNKLVLIPLLVIVLTEKVAYGFFSLASNTAVLSKFKVIPLYQPLTFTKIAVKYFDYKPTVQASNTIQLNANIDYPLKPIELVENPKTFNIFIFASDSVKSSVIDEKIAPNIQAFKEDAIVLNRHYSGGNTTRFGLFSFLYGLNASYWFSFVDAKKGSVLFDVLKQLNYQINITSATNTNWPEFKTTSYIRIQESIKDEFDGVPWKKDEQATAYFKQWVEQQSPDKPIFSFVFLDAPHGYSFPDSANLFKVTNEEVNYLTLKPNSNEIKVVEKQYKNAVFYDDKLFGEMLKKLKEQGLYKNSLIIYTSDHGQEFFEYGDFGHNTNFSEAQLKVPMIIKLPDYLQNKIQLPNGMSRNILGKLTSHQDIVPTLLTLIGLKNKVADYSNGKNIFSQDYKRDKVVSSNWNGNAIVTDELTYVFSNTPDKIFSNEIRESSTYKPVLNGITNSKAIIDVINENKQFLKGSSN